MASNIFVNLPVRDLGKSVAFFTSLGYHFNPRFTDESATCMVVSEHIYVMLLTEERFRSFTPKPICDARSCTEVLICLQVDSRAEVDTLMSKALAAGGTSYKALQDQGFMYGHGFQDLDGHIWEIIYMDSAALAPG